LLAKSVHLDHNFYESSFIMKTENEFPIFLNLFKKLLAPAKIAKELIGMRVYNKIYTHGPQARSLWPSRF
jgi:hypothetical protein